MKDITADLVCCLAPDECDTTQGIPYSQLVSAFGGEDNVVETAMASIPHVIKAMEGKFITTNLYAIAAALVDKQSNKVQAG